MATQGTEPPVSSGEIFDEDVSWRLATAVIRSLRGFRIAGAGTEAAAIPGELGHTPKVQVLPDGSVHVDDGPRRVALAGLRLAGAAATAPGPAGALLESGVFHVLWRLPSDPAATPAGIALALGALCQGVRHAEVLQVFVTKVDGEESDSPMQLGGYEACASVLSAQVREEGAVACSTNVRVPYAVSWFSRSRRRITLCSSRQRDSVTHYRTHLTMNLSMRAENQFVRRNYSRTSSTLRA